MSPYPFFYSVILIITSLFTFSSCGEKQPYIVVNNGHFSTDSIELYRLDTVISLSISDQIYPRPYRTQLYSDSCNTYYLLLNERTLYFFNLNDNSLCKTITFNNCGSLSNYSGFSFINPDSIFTYNYGTKELFLNDSTGIVIKKYDLKSENSDNIVSPEALNYSPIIISNQNAILSGTCLNSKSRLSKDDNISALVNLSNDNISYGAHYADVYSKGFFGGVYMNSIYHCKDNKNRIVYSFPASNYIYRYDSKLNYIDSLYMGSRYTDIISSSHEPTFMFMSDKKERINYYVHQHSYGEINYDKYRDIYYRIARHPLNNYDGQNMRKPFSIIAMKPDGTIISETPILTDYSELLTSNIHVTPLGLIIQKESKDENVLEFILYNIKEI